MKKHFCQFLIIFAFILFMSASAAFAQDFYVSNSGNDSNSGKSMDKPWKTISMVNSHTFSPGDVIHFKCGDVWREQLIPASGSENGNIKYTSYGNGNKPLLLGSISMNNKNDWINNGRNIWSIKPLNYKNIDQYNISVKDIAVWSSDNALIEKQTTEAEINLLQVTCSKPGTTSSDIQLIIDNLKIKNGKSYTLSFKAKTTLQFTISDIILMKGSSPWSSLSSFNYDSSPVIKTQWSNYKVTFISNKNDDNARITMMLGKDLPANSTLLFKDFSFSEIMNSDINYDVGNVIFNESEAYGIKVFSESELNRQNEFFYDKNKKTVKIYSKRNPAELYFGIELALTRNIIDENNKSFVEYNNLHLKYGGAHGIGGTNTSHITVRSCEISHIGGGELFKDTEGNHVRYGNGIEFWDNAHDNLVEFCRIWEVYDAALTNQGNSKDVNQYNITYRNNDIKDCEYSFEYWNGSETGFTRNIHFDSNVCRDAGYGWGHNQRPDPSGMHVTFFDNAASTSDIFVTNNLFSHSASCTLYMSKKWNQSGNLIFKNNRYIYPENTVIATWGIQQNVFSYLDFTKFKKMSADNRLYILDYLVNESGNKS